MKDKIFLITQDKTLQEMEATAYLSEDSLQRLLSDYPDLLAGYQMNEPDPRRWLLVAREIGIADDLAASERWSLDHLFLDQDGTPTLVEVKRATDTRIRREVAGQMLDYAANAILHWSPEVVSQRFNDQCQARGVDPAEEVAALLKIKPEDGDAIEAFWQLVFNKLKMGQVRLVFVADKIPKELRRIIEFLNEHMQEVEVLGVELPQYVGSGLTTIVPKLVGRTSMAEQTKKPADSRQWDEESFFTDMRQKDIESVEVAQIILDWSKKMGLEILWGKGSTKGRFSPAVKTGEKFYKPFLVWTTGKIELCFPDCPEPFKSNGSVNTLVTNLNAAVSEFQFNFDSNDEKYPKRDLRMISDPDTLNRVLEIFEKHLREIQVASVTNS